MAKLVIVESPAKAKTIGKYLGKDYEVTASMGHIRDLPKSQLGIDVEHDYAPQYINIKDKSKLIKELKSKAKHSDGVILATDPDREGAAISWHLANILGLFDVDNTVLVPDPVYPVYVDTNVMAGRKIVFADANEANGFLPLPDESVQCDIIYICSPNNPTGSAYTKEQLEQWVAYALKNDAVILYDAAYEAYVTDPAIPRSIFVIEDAKKCAIELCSLSKTAGFTGTRCGYTVVPHALVRKTESGKEMELNKMWLRRQTTKFNGVPYIIQRGAEAVFSEEGIKQCRESIAYYQENARIIMEGFDKVGIKYYGGVHSPYIWLQCPNGMSSWEFFDFLLEKLQVVGTPGAGFGKMGEGFFRLTAFGSRENTIEAMERIINGLKK